MAIRFIIIMQNRNGMDSKKQGMLGALDGHPQSSVQQDDSNPYSDSE